MGFIRLKANHTPPRKKCNPGAFFCASLRRDEFCARTIWIMNQQLSFFKEPEPRVAKYNLFLGIFPDSSKAQSIIEFADTLRRKHGLRGRVRPVSHLHVSLFFLGGVNDVPASAVEVIGQV